MSFFVVIFRGNAIKPTGRRVEKCLLSLLGIVTPGTPLKHQITDTQSKCPLCFAENTVFYWQDKKREYRQCTVCDLVFVPSSFHLSAQDEKAEYDKHDNAHLDDGYRRFLNRTLQPLLSAVKESFQHPICGLDFGCGEGAFLSQMAAQSNVKVANYDLYYHCQPSVLERHYDFIVMTEVLEHLAAPKITLEKLVALLNPGGILAIMTKRVIDQNAFTTWHYKNDPTHICFYSDTTFQFIAQNYNMHLAVIEKDVVFLFKAGDVASERSGFDSPRPSVINHNKE